MEYFAESTARITAQVFQHGANVIGQEDKKQPLFELGYRFGTLVYALDTFQYLRRDEQDGSFNPLS